MKFVMFGFGNKYGLYAYNENDGFTARFVDDKWVRSPIGYWDMLQNAKGIPDLIEEIDFNKAKDIFLENDPAIFFENLHKKGGAEENCNQLSMNT